MLGWHGRSFLHPHKYPYINYKQSLQCLAITQQYTTVISYHAAAAVIKLLSIVLPCMVAIAIGWADICCALISTRGSLNVNTDFQWSPTYIQTKHNNTKIRTCYINKSIYNFLINDNKHTASVTTLGKEFHKFASQ